MNPGFLASLTWYKLLTDWGGLLGGGAALVAAGNAYLAGQQQVETT